LGLNRTQAKVEKEAKCRITQYVVENGGTKKDGRVLGVRLVRLTKNIQRVEGVPDSPNAKNKKLQKPTAHVGSNLVYNCSS